MCAFLCHHRHFFAMSDSVLHLDFASRSLWMKEHSGYHRMDKAKMSKDQDTQGHLFIFPWDDWVHHDTLSVNSWLPFGRSSCSVIGGLSGHVSSIPNCPKNPTNACIVVPYLTAPSLGIMSVIQSQRSFDGIFRSKAENEWAEDFGNVGGERVTDGTNETLKNPYYIWPLSIFKSIWKSYWQEYNFVGVVQEWLLLPMVISEVVQLDIIQFMLLFKSISKQLTACSNSSSSNPPMPRSCNFLDHISSDIDVRALRLRAMDCLE